MNHEEYLLEMRKIDKRFPGTHALDSVDFNLKKGEVHSLIGQNGSGKSTLMNILAGGLAKDAGQIIRKGEEIHITSPISARNNGIAMIHQELNLFSEVTVGDNLYFGAIPKYRGLICWNEMFADADEAMRMLSGEIKGRQKIAELSVAQQQLVEIVRAILKKTEIIIMDEPTASLTNDEADGLFKVVEKIKASGVSIIFISHRLDEVMRISDRVTVLRDGKLIGTLERNEIQGKEQLVDMMVNIKPVVQKNGNRKISKEIVLETRNLSMSNRLSDVSVKLHKGEVLGLAGLVGAGRTELLKTVFGAYKPDKGEIVVGGQAWSEMTPAKAVRLGIAYMSEDRKDEGLLLKMTCEENTVYSCMESYSRFGLIRPGKQREDYQKLAGDLRLKASSPKDPAGALSGGNQQKLVIAKWLAAQSTIILMDEPTRGIDVGAKSEIYALIRKLADEGKSIIFVSSELEEVQLVSDRILVMNKGRITKELPANSTVEEMMCYAV